MRLDPKKVKFYPPFLDLGIHRVPLRFSGKGCTMQLLETALIVEGNVLKVGLFGLERSVQAALSEWSVLTLPYSRIREVKLNRYSLFRVLGLLLVVLSVGLGVLFSFNFAEQSTLVETILIPLFGVMLGLLMFLMTGPRFTLKVCLSDGAMTSIIFRIRSKRLQSEFAQKLEDYRCGSARFNGAPLADIVFSGGTGGQSQGLVSYRSSVCLVLFVSVLAIFADWYTEMQWSVYQFGGFSQFCLLADAFNANSGPLGWFAMALEWVLVPLAFLPVLSRPSKRVRMLLIGYAVLRLAETLLGIYWVWDRNVAVAQIGLPLMLMSLTYIWWLKKLATKSMPPEGAAE